MPAKRSNVRMLHPTPRGRLVAGYDIGSVRDPSTAVIVEANPNGTFDVVHAERYPLGLPFSEITAKIATLNNRLWFRNGEAVIDATGVGAAVRDSLRERGAVVIGVTFTAGDAERKVQQNRTGEDWHVSRSLLFKGLTSTVYGGKLRIARELEGAKDLLGELADLEVAIAASGRERIDVPAEADHHGDLVVALSLALWRLQRPQPVAGNFRLTIPGRIF